MAPVMKEKKPSFSAEVMAFYRAAESVRPEAERLYYDPLARAFLSTPLRLLVKSRFLAGMVIWFVTERWIPGGVGVVLARSKYVDDCLRDCLAEGIGQLVILGAGYDSRAYRSFAFRREVRVFEVDHPATQAAKIRGLRRQFGYLPKYVAFVPVDFMEEEPTRRLLDSGYDRTIKTLFIWEGVSYYLSPEAVDNVLSFVARNSSRGSSLIFDYFVQLSAAKADELGTSTEKLDWIARSAKGSGEPVMFRLRPESVGEFLSSRGFHMRANVTAQDLKQLYFKGRSQDRKVSPHLGVVHAAVA
jgi:methyltransferase (TIGR00027 family)